MYEYRETGPFRRAIRRVAGTRAVSRVNARALHHVDRLVFRLTGGGATFASWVTGVPIVMLTTTGARTGERRTLPVLGFPYGDNLILIASNYGKPRNPAWYHNLRAHPRASVAVDGVTREVEAHEVSGEERERYYRRGVEIYPAWAQYERWASNRRIPVIRLSPRAEASARHRAAPPTMPG
jgi:deazaflavin-dependent oxidoreductase (nitroreductase family)